MPCCVAGHWTRLTSFASQKSSGKMCWLFAGGRRVLGIMAVTVCSSVPFWFMAPTGWVVRGGCRVVVTTGDIVLVTVVGWIVVVVLSGVEVTGPAGRKTVEDKQSFPYTKYPSLPIQVFSCKILIFKNAYAYYNSTFSDVALHRSNLMVHLDLQWIPKIFSRVSFHALCCYFSSFTLKNIKSCT